MADEDYSGKLVWFIAGAALGASIALLYAPASGPETRRRITEKAGEGRQRFTESSREVLDRGRDLFEKGKQIVDEAAGVFEQGRKLVQG